MEILDIRTLDKEVIDSSERPTEQKIVDFIKKELTEQLELTEPDWDKELTFDQLGIDSFMTIDIHRKWRELFSELPATFLIENNTIDKLAKYLKDNYSDYFFSAPVSNKLDIEAANLFIKKEFESFLNEPIPLADQTLGFDQLGIDSFMTIDIHRKWRELFPELPATFLIENNTIEKLAKYLLENYPEKFLKEENLYPHTSIKEKIEINQLTKITKEQREKDDLSHLRETAEDTINSKEQDQYAIIGLTGRYPDAENIFEFWNNLATGVSSTSELNDKRWQNQRNFNESKAALLNEIKNFDADFFGISKELAISMDPQERILLEESWKVLTDAGLLKGELDNPEFKVGCFLGTMYSGYGELAYNSWVNGKNTLAHSGRWILANKVTNYFNLKGPSVTFDTACSSSMTAIHYACLSLKNQECEVAIAGGINLISNAKQYDRLQQLGEMSKSGITKPFSKEADGFVEGEGVGLIALKSLAQAKADKDYIYGVIKSSAINTNSGTNDLGTPDLNAKEEAMSTAMTKAAIQPEDITYIEAHAMGTLLGDSLEVRAINKLFSDREKPLCIGTLKGNIGHTEGSSGIAAITKVLLQFKYNKIVPTIHTEPRSDLLSLGNKIQINTQVIPWGNTGNQHALINSSGAGGVNISVVLEAFDNEVYHEESSEEFFFSAKSQDSLKKYLKSFSAFLKIEASENTINMALLAKTLKSRQVLNFSLKITASTVSDIIEKLENILSFSDEVLLEYINKHPIDEVLFEEVSKSSNKRAVQRIPIPGYSFESHAYWLEEDAITYSLDNQLISGHVSFGKPTVLGTQLIMCGLKKYPLNETTSVLHNISFEDSLELSEGEKVTIEQTLNQERKLTISSEKAIHMRGTLPDELDPSMLSRPMKECPVESTVIDLPAMYAKKQATYAMNLRIIEEVRVTNKEVWSIVNLSQHKQLNLSDQYALLLDAAFLTRLGLNKTKVDTKLPFYIKSVYFQNNLALTDQNFVFLVQKEESEDIWRGDIDIYNAKKQLVFSIKDIICKSGVKELNQEIPRIQEESIDKETLESELVNYLEKILNHQLSEHEYTTTFMQMGCSSKDLIDFSEQIQKNIAKDFLPTSLFEHQTLQTLTAYLMKEASLVISKDDGQKKMDTSNLEIASTNKDVAIIGISGRMPNSSSLEDFISQLYMKKELIEEIPEERWNWSELFEKTEKGETGTKINRASFIKQISEFDNTYFGITPREAMLMDPQQRISLELAVEAIEDAGYSTKYFDGQDTSVFIGSSGHDYLDLIKKETDYEVNTQLLTGNSHNMLAGRISYWLNLLGQSKPIDTACSSSLVALHEAVMNIRTGACATALVGGVNLIIDSDMMVAFDKFGILNKEGKCRAFDSSASGTVRGEGAGFVLLKGLSEAKKDGDHIYGVIKGTAVNHDGRSNSLTAPSLNQQKEVIKASLNDAGLSPNSVTYIESHGTATKLGDPIEVQAIKEAYTELWNQELSSYTTKNTIIGSLKNNIGHLEAASGMASLFKVLLSFKHKKIAADINRNELSQYIDIDDTPFHFTDQVIDWNPEGKRIAGISSFGFSGTNAHIIIEEYKNQDTAEMLESSDEQLIVLSANQKEDLGAYVNKLAQWLDIQFGTKEGSKDILSGLKLEQFNENLSLIDCGFSVYEISKIRKNLFEYGMILENKNIDSTTKISELKEFVYQKTIHSDILFTDLVNTLKFSRSDRKEKLFFHAKDMSELRLKLSQFSWEKVNNLAIDGSLTDIDKAIKSQFLSQRADYLYYSDEFTFDLMDSVVPNYQKISLPAYPFNRKKFWFKKQKLDRGPQLDLINFDENILSGHKFNDKSVIPGAFSLAKLYEFITKEKANQKIMLADIQLKKLVEVNEENKACKVKLEDSRYQILTPDNQSFIQAQYADDVMKKSGVCFEQSEGTKVNEDVFYQAFEKSGFRYSSEYKVISDYVYTNEFCSAKIAITAKKGANQFNFLHLEGAFQAAGYLFNNNEEANNLFIPYGIKKYKVFDQLEATSFVSIQIVTNTSQLKIANINIFNQNKELCIAIEGYQCKQLKKLSNTYEVLTKKSIPLVNKKPSKTFMNESNLLLLNDRFLENNSFLKNRQDIKILNELNNGILDLASVFENHVSFNKFYDEHLKNNKSDYLLIIDYFDKNQNEAAVLSLLKRYQILCKQQKLKEIEYLVLCDSRNKLGLGINGMVRCLNLENSRISFKTISLETEKLTDEQLENVLIQTVGSEQEEFLSLDDTISVPILAPAVCSDEVSINSDNYQNIWIIGGLNGVGYGIAKEMLQRHNANIYISGKTEFNSKIEDKIQRLAQINPFCEVKYFQVDVQSKVSLTKTLNKIGNKHLGIFFAAGVINDSLAHNKSFEDFQKVVQPKVAGIKNLLNVLDNREVAFLALLSSITSIIGNAGQADYAFANGFLDQQALENSGKNFKILSLNLPALQEGNMQKRKKFSESLQTSDFIDVIEKYLDSEYRQVILKLNTQKARDTMENDREQTIEAKNIIKILAEITGIEEGQINKNQTLEELGIDSILVTELINSIEKASSVQLSPSFLYGGEVKVKDIIKEISKIQQSEASGAKQEKKNLLDDYQNNTTHVKENIFNDNNVLEKIQPNHVISNSSKIAVIGISGEFPLGMSTSSYFEGLLDKKSIFDERASYFNEEYYKNYAYSFDADFFGISPKNAALMDPQQRKILETVWRALEDAGYDKEQIQGNNVGVFMGVSNSEYAEKVSQIANVNLGITDNASFWIANKISQYFDFHGPSEVIDTACSSSLSAIHRACQALKNDECELAVVGGVNILSSQQANQRFLEAGFLSETNKMSFLDEAADGLVRTSGWGVIILERLFDAENNKNQIQALILNTVSNHNGKANSQVAMNSNAMKELIKKNLTTANISPKDIQYVEMQGNNSLLGDQIEFEAITDTFNEFNEAYSTYIGSCKQNIGHMEAASGIGGLTKLVSAMAENKLPGNIKYKKLNPQLHLKCPLSSRQS